MIPNMKIEVVLVVGFAASGGEDLGLAKGLTTGEMTEWSQHRQAEIAR